jgi:hypothetical protein
VPPGAVGGAADPEKARAARALQSGDSLAAMEAFERLAAKKDEDRVEKEAKVALLNETSFDRRRQVRQACLVAPEALSERIARMDCPAGK